MIHEEISATEWWERRRVYGGPPDVGSRCYREDPAGDPVLAEAMEIGAHWSDQPAGQAGWYVRLRTVGPDERFPPGYMGAPRG